MGIVSKVKFVNYRMSIALALDLIKAPEKIPQDGLIIVKPNLTNTSPPPVTTPVEAAEAVVLYCRRYSGAEIAIGEGSGSGQTQSAFDTLGYSSLASRCSLRLIDFNSEKTLLCRRSDTIYLKEFHMPSVVKDAFIISLPVLKDHCFTVTTIAMKNMFGIAPAPYYGGSWNKSKLHSPSAHHSVVDICLYKKPSLSIVDASTALSGGHLWGTPRPLGVILASTDPVSVDAEGSRLLGHIPEKIEYLVKSDGVLGDIEARCVITSDLSDGPYTRRRPVPEK